MTTVWVWDARGAARSAGGVADDAKRARELAAQSLLASGAAEVVLEQASAVLGIGTLSYSYVRTGQRWRGHRTARGRVAWQRLRDGDATPRRAAS